MGKGTLFDTNEAVFEGVSFALAEDLLRAAGEMRFIARGGSMLPAIIPGDELIVHRARLQDVHAGDVVLFTQNGRWYAHRVREIVAGTSSPSLITQGDALTEYDGPVFAQELLGRIAFLVRGGEQLVLSPAGSFEHVLLRAAIRHVPHFAGGILRWHRLLAWFLSLWHGTAGFAHTKSRDSV
jgi:hypothetical protein